jgi:hypothetical protein
LLGFLFPFIGILLFIIPVFVCTTKEPFDHDIDDCFDDIVDEKDKQPNKVVAIELA